MEVAHEDCIKIVIDGEPVAKGRARITVRGGFARAYTPAKTASYEDRVRFKAKMAMGEIKPLSCPIKLTVNAFLVIPTSWSTRKKIDAACGGILPAKRPDLDNYVKSAMDALNNIAFLDDSQVVEISTSKVYDENPRLEIEIEPFKIKLRAI